MTASPSDSPESTPDQIPQAPVPSSAEEEEKAPTDSVQPQTFAAEPPAADSPVADSPAAEPPVADSPVADSPTAEPPVADQAAAEPAEDSDVAAEPAEDSAVERATTQPNPESETPDTQSSAASSTDAEPDRTEPDQAEPDQAEPDQTEPDQASESKTEPDQTSQGETEPAQAKSAEADTPSEPGKKGKKKKPEKKKPAGPNPAAIVKTIGATSEAALVYVQNPDPKLSRMARKHREAVITEIPPVTAGALLGPEALCRHFLASAASGRYRDLFFLWDLFVLYPEDCKAVLNARQKAQEKAKSKLRTATHMGLLGDADRVASDIDRAAGLPWRWLREVLQPMEPAISQRPAVLAAMARREADFTPALPDQPSDRWLAEAATLKESGKDIPEAMDALLGAHADRLPATVATLSMAQQQYPDRVPALIDRIDLDAPDIGSLLAWARDHDHAEQLLSRITDRVSTAAAADRAAGLAAWKQWQDRGVDVDIPSSVTTPNLEGLDLGRPESADLIKLLIDGGADLDAQQILDDVAAGNRMLGEKAFEAFVCAGFDAVHLPMVLEGNPMVRPETRCPSCQAWTWVRPGLEKRCPRDECPLRQPAQTSADDEGAAIDAAVAGLDSLTQPQADIPEPAQGGSEDRPADASTPNRPADAPPTDQPVETPPIETPPIETPPVKTSPVDGQPVDALPGSDIDPSAPGDTSGANGSSSADEVTDNATN